MSVSLKMIANGFLHRFNKKKKTSRFPVISWLQAKKLKHQNDQSLKSFFIGNLEIKYKRPYELLHTYKELFKDEIYRFDCAKEAPLIIDCGANIGLSVLYFKTLFPAAKIIAFEPDNGNYQLLAENCKLNKLSDVENRRSAVWIKNEVLSFTSDGTQGSQISTDSNKKNTIQVNAERLADLLKDNKVDFLKIDIEGAEVEVMQDCEPFLKNVTNLFVEYHGKANETERLSALLNLLKPHYQVYIKLAADNLSYPFVQKNTGAAFDVQLNIFCYQ